MSPYRQKLVRTLTSKQLPTLKLPVKPSHRKSASNIPFCLSPSAIDAKRPPAKVRRRPSVAFNELSYPTNSGVLTKHHEATLAKRLDLQLTERLERGGCQTPQLDVYSSIFEDVIEKDEEYGFLLRKIKHAYDSALSNGLTSERRTDSLLKANQSNTIKLACLESELNKAKEELRCMQTVQKDNRRLRSEIEDLKLCLAKSQSSFSIPKLNLRQVNSADFHSEFLENVDEFSLSWQKALHNGR